MSYRRSRAPLLAWLFIAGLVVLSWAWPWPTPEPGCVPYACRDPFTLHPIRHRPSITPPRRHVALVRSETAAKVGSNVDVTDFLNRLSAAAKIDNHLLDRSQYSPQAPTSTGGVEEPPAAPELTGPLLDELESGPKWHDLREHLEQQPESDLAAAALEAEADSPFTQSWTMPNTLLARLESLQQYPQCQHWAATTAAVVRDLAAGDDSIRTAALNLVQEQLAEAGGIIASLNDDAAKSHARRVQYALERHVAVWSGLASLQATRQGAVAVVHYDSGRLVPFLRDVAATLHGSEHEPGWRRYLLMDDLEALALKISMDHDAATIARRALRRLQSPYLNEAQRAFLHLPAYRTLVSELQRVADEPVDERELLSRLEAYESSGRASLASLLGEDFDRMRLSPRADERELAQRLETYFRNTNVRLSVSEAFLSRLVSESNQQTGPVRGVMLGVPYHGRQTANTQTTIEMLPGSDPFQVMLVTRGTVVADTAANRGIVTTESRTLSDFTVRKRIEFRRDGLHPHPAEVTVQSRQALCDVESGFDGVPVMGGLMRNITARQFDARRPETTAIAQMRIQREAAANSDAATDAALARLQHHLERNLLLPLERLALRPAAVVDRPQEDEVNVRVRLATYRQLGAHTPRPKAPADSLASIQLHETAMNNILDRLRLAGRELSLADLWKETTPTIAEAGQVAQGSAGAQGDAVEGADASPTAANQASDDALNIRLKFAPYDPLQVQCLDGHIRATLRLDALHVGAFAFEDLVVHVDFKPVRRDRNVYLVKTGPVVVAGPHINIAQQAMLQSAISGFLSRRGGMPVVPPALLQQPRMNDIAVMQCELADGWIAVALGPAENVMRTTSRGMRDAVQWSR